MIDDITLLIALFAETLATCGDTELEHFVFDINERWRKSISIIETQSQSDRCVGFDSFAFIWSQQQRLKHCIGHFTPVEYVSSFLATWRMYFPFFACESGMRQLDVSDKQDAHSMTMAARNIAEFFKLVNRDDELRRKVLAFFISHNATTVTVYGYYAVVKDRAAEFYRHSIHAFVEARRNLQRRFNCCSK